MNTENLDIEIDDEHIGDYHGLWLFLNIKRRLHEIFLLFNRRRLVLRNSGSKVKVLSKGAKDRGNPNVDEKKDLDFKGRPTY